MPGTFPGHGGIRMVPGRTQNRMPPSIGLNFPAIGPQEPASPTVSRNIVHNTNFWYTIGTFHHAPTSHGAPTPEVNVISVKPRPIYRTSSFTTYVAGIIFGLPNP